VEILVASVILTVLILGTATVFLSSKRYTRHARLSAVSSELSKTLMDSLHMDVRLDLWGTNCLSAGLLCPGAQIVDNIAYTPTYVITNVAGTTLRRARLRINWNEP
jgi:hypothetical protein